MSFNALVDTISTWDDFFRTFSDTASAQMKYRIKITEAYSRSESWISVLFEDILNFNQSLANYLRNYPERAIAEAIRVFKDIYQSENPETYNRELPYEVRITTHNGSNEVSLRNLKSTHIEKLIYTKGIIIKQSPPKPQITLAQYECPVCQARQSIPQILETEELSKPEVCSNPNCTNKKKFTLIAEFSDFIDYQKAIIQEAPEELSAGVIPRNVTVIFTQNLVDSVRPGERLRIMGVYKSRPIELQRGKQSSIFDPYIKVISIEGIKSEEDAFDITPEEIIEIQRLSKLPNIRAILCHSIAPSIFGVDHLKMAALLSLISGVQKELSSGNKIRGDIHVLFMGDPGTGKSQILQFCSTLSSRSIYTSGKGASAAGLTAAVIRDGESSGYSLEAGALVLASGGCACIDEFDKMEKNDRSAIHQAMEQQTISISKAGINATLPAKTAIIAAANPKWGKYNPYKTPMDNMNLPGPIISRFDLIFIVRDIPEKDTDEMICDHVLINHLPQNTAAIIPDQNEIINHDLLKKYIRHARNTYKPILTQEAADAIKTYYLGIRASGAPTETIAIVVRYLEALIRMSEAIAKIRLSEYATLIDAEYAIELMNRSLLEIGLDPETGRLDMGRLHSSTSQNQLRRITAVLDVITRMQIDRGNRAIKLVDLYAQIEEEGNVDKEFAYQAVEILKTKSEIYSPHSDEVKLMKELEI